MAKKDFRIDTVAGRAKLVAKREPYWHRIESGCYVGYRKLIQGEGTWIARWRNPDDGKQHYHSLEHQDDFDTAVRSARVWFTQCEGGTPQIISVAEACRRYVNERRLTKGETTADDAEGRFKRHIFDASIGKIELGRLKTGDITNWLHSLVKTEEDFEDEDEETDELIRRSKDSANRNLATFKAALNLAFREGMAPASTAWDRVQSFHDVGRRRTRFLTLAERSTLIDAAPKDLATLIKSVAYTGARPGEIANALIKDLSPNGSLELDGKTGRRAVPLAPKALKHFLACAGKREETAPLLVRVGGSKWDRYSWRDAMQEARTSAGLPQDVVLYSFRHAAISEMIINGIDPLTVARIVGTSLTMIQKHYGHLREEKALAQLAKIKMVK